MAVVGAWLVPWALYGRREGVARPLGMVWPPWGRGLIFAPRMAPWRRGWSPRIRLVNVGACPIFWATYGLFGGIARFLGPVQPPWGRRPILGPRMAIVGA